MNRLESTPENRSVEYDTLSPDYAEFLLTEILPEAYKEYNITDDPEGHAICGISSGGICAFTVAWNVPTSSARSSAMWAVLSISEAVTIIPR